MKKISDLSNLAATEFSRCSVTTYSKRRAVVTVMVLVVLLLMSGMIAQFIRRAVGDRRQLRQELRQQQTQQLAVAAQARVLRQHSKDPAYSGETWNIPAGVIDQTNTAQVVITVKDDMATVVAKYPVNLDLPIQVTRTIRLPQ